MKGENMETETISLTIEGKPGQDVQVWYRGDRDSESEDPAPIVYTGKIGADGSVTISVPRAYLVLGTPVRRGGIPLELHREEGASKTVRMPENQD
jgi:hypothetical protein